MTIKALYPTVRPTLNLDFAKTKALDPRITFTRASTATFVGADGLIQTAASGAPRFDHNPATGESLGLLVEEARTNLLLNSATLSTQSATVTATSTTLSFYGTGTVTLTGVSTAGPLVGTGASNRVSLTFTPTAGSLTLTVSGSVTNAQLEAGSFPTSYIPTTTATVTRAADVASMTGTNFSSWYRQDEGTFLGKGRQTYTTPNQFESLITVGGYPNRTWSWAIIGNNNTWNVGTDGLNTCSFYTGLTPNVPFSFNVAQAQENNQSVAVADGVIKASATPSQILYTNAGGLSIGNKYDGHIARLAFYPVRLPDAQLQALTAT